MFARVECDTPLGEPAESSPSFADGGGARDVGAEVARRSREGRRAQILLQADARPKWTDRRIAEAGHEDGGEHTATLRAGRIRGRAGAQAGGGAAGRGCSMGSRR